MSTSNTPNMNLILPGVASEPGPDYAQEINNDLQTLDAHDHSPGKGTTVPTSGLNINATLTFNNNFATGLAGLTLVAQGSTPVNSTVYRSGVDLYFVDGLGHNIPITANGSVAGATGNIANLASPASATYVSVSSTFVWQSNTSIAAHMDCGSVIMRNLSPNSTYALTLQPPSGLSSNYAITLPFLPASAKVMSINSSGTVATGVAGTVDSTDLATDSVITVKIADLNVTAAKIADLTITTAKIADLNVTSAKIDDLAISTAKLADNAVVSTKILNAAVVTSKLADSAVTPVKMAAYNLAASVSCGTFAGATGQVTSLSLTITVSGLRPVYIALQPDATTTPSYIVSNATALGQGQLFITRDGGQVWTIDTFVGSNPQLSFIDTPSAGLRTYTARVTGAGAITTVNHMLLIAYEL